MNQSVLIVDDSKYMRTLIRNNLMDRGYNIVGEAASGEKAIDKAIELNPDIITLDNILPDMLGLDILKVLKEEKLHSKVIFISAVGQQSMIDKVMELGASAYIVKPYSDDHLNKTIKNIYHLDDQMN